MTSAGVQSIPTVLLMYLLLLTSYTVTILAAAGTCCSCSRIHRLTGGYCQHRHRVVVLARQPCSLACR